MDIQNLFAERIGGQQFGKVKKVFKFTLIEHAKSDFLANNPNARLIDMGVGEPEERAPQRVIDKLYSEALKVENRVYPCNNSIEFRRAAAAYLERKIGQSFDPATEIMHCIGAKNALVQLPLAFVNPGDVVAVTSPGYPTLQTVSEYLGATILKLKLVRENNYLPDLEYLEAEVKRNPIKILLLNYPNNPTGAVANLEFYSRVIELAYRYSFLVIQDAAYADLCYAKPFCSPLQVSGARNVCIEVYSLSKSYNMQGFRLGFVASGPELTSAFSLIKDNTDNGQFLAIQQAGIEALNFCQDCVDQNARKYLGRLESVARIFSQAGLKVEVPGGGIYLYLPVPVEWRGYKFESAQDFSNFMIANLGVVSVPWDEAGPHVRLSMTFSVGGSSFPDEASVFQALSVGLENL